MYLFFLSGLRHDIFEMLFTLSHVRSSKFKAFSLEEMPASALALTGQILLPLKMNLDSNQPGRICGDCQNIL